jgi:1-acyl-sn-glycerol-3-phosphate acyltransferase
MNSYAILDSPLKKELRRYSKAFALFSLWIVFFATAALMHSAISLTGRGRVRWRWVSRLSRAFSLLCAKLLGIKVSRSGGDEVGNGGAVIVCNHVGYVDGVVLGSVFPVVYVSKREVRGWPVIGAWNALIGTIFVDRGRKEKTRLLIDQTIGRLKQRANLLVFPEGTSTNSERVLPFQTVLFAPPLIARAPVVPVTLTYTRVGNQPVSVANWDQIYWYGDMEFMSHFWNLLTLQNIEVSVKVHPKIDTFLYKNNSWGRKQLSQDCYRMIASSDIRSEKRIFRPTAGMS